MQEDEQNCALPEPILELVRYNYAICSKYRESADRTEKKNGALISLP